jgi:hypothetical protein
MHQRDRVSPADQRPSHSGEWIYVPGYGRTQNSKVG